MYINNNSKAVQTEKEESFRGTPPSAANLTEFALEFSSNTTLHGYRYLFAERGHRRLIWFLIMITAVCFSVYFVRDQFYSYGNKTKTTVEIEDVKFFDFPSVTFCLAQPTFYKKYDLSIMNLTKKEIATLYEAIGRAFTRHRPFNESKTIRKLTAANITSYGSFLHLFSMTMTEMERDYMIMCQYEGQKCQLTDFKPTLSPQGHLCTTFNFYKKNEPSLKTSSISPDSGLDIVFNLNLQRRLLDDVLANQMLYFAAHPYGHFIDMTMITDFQVLRSGTANIIRLDETQVSTTFIVL